MREWFGDVPAFIIALATDYCAECNDLEFCALIEHERYHLAHATDKYGQPACKVDEFFNRRTERCAVTTINSLRPSASALRRQSPSLPSSRAKSWAIRYVVLH